MYTLLINAPQLQTLLAQGTPCAVLDCPPTWTRT
jgi:hypothetical protein